MKDLVKSQLLKYLSGEISKEHLCKWAVDILHDMLKGDIFDIGYLEIWGIITGLAEMSDIDDLCCNKLAHQFVQILTGEECASFTIAIQIPQKFVVNNLLQTKNILLKYSGEKQLSKTEVAALEFITQKEMGAINTLNEILEMQIRDLLKLGYEFYSDEGRIEFNLKSTVFISEDMSMTLENDLLAKIIALLECYDGKRCFYVYAGFNNGVVNISIQT